MWIFAVASSVASSQSARQGSSTARRLKKELKEQKEAVTSDEPVLDIPHEMQQMLQTFRSKLDPN